MAKSSKRAIGSLNEEDESDLTDLEDVAGPSTSTVAKAKAISGFAYSPGRTTRSTAKRVKLEADDNVKLEETEPSFRSPAKPARVRKVKTESSSPKKAKPIQMELDKPHTAPSHWEEAYNLIKEMRKDTSAPVDTMGCACALQDEPDEKVRRLGVLISLMLSSQTKDEVTTEAVRKLRKAIGEFTIENIIRAEESTIQDAICKVGFWRRKSGYIKQAAQKMKDNFDSEVPKTVDDLCSLPGVGPKMAFLTLQVAWKLNLGIGVDVHVHRITNRLGWHKPPTTTPEQTRLNLQSWLPKELFADINPLLVGFGQVICTPLAPKCGSCLLAERGLCPSAVKVKAKAKSASKTKAATMKKSVGDVMKDEEDAASIVKTEDDADTDPTAALGDPSLLVKIEP